MTHDELFQTIRRYRIGDELLALSCRDGFHGFFLVMRKD